MKKLFIRLNAFIISISALCLVGNTQAAVLDFEGLGAEGSLITSIAGVPELTISGGTLVVPGNPRTSFNGNSSGSGPGGIDDANSGNTLTSQSNGSTVVFDFSKNIRDLQFFAIDIEAGSVTEIFSAEVFDVDGNSLNSITLTGGDTGTGDGVLSLVDFSTGFAGSNLIRRLEFSALTAQSINPGYAVDNFSYSISEIPIPAAAWLFGTALIGFVGYSRRKKIGQLRG